MNDKEIKIKVTIDGKEGIAVLSSTNIEYEKLLKYSKQLPTASGNSFKGMTNGASGARMAISQLGFALGDFSMITVNARMALMGVGNNFPFIIQGFQQMSASAKEAGRSIKDEFFASMKGGGGIILGSNAMLFAFQSLPVLLEALNKKAKEAAEQGLKSFERQLKNISDFNVARKIGEVTAEIEILSRTIEQQKEVLGFFPSLWISLFGTNATPALDAANKKLEMLKDKEKEINEQKKTRVGLLQIEIDNLDAQIKTVGNVEGAEKKITVLADKKAAKEKEMHSLLETTEDKHKRIRSENEKASKESLDKTKNEIESYKLDADAGRISLAQYKSYLEKRLNHLRTNSLEEKQIYAELKKEIEELNKKIIDPVSRHIASFDDAEARRDAYLQKAGEHSTYKGSKADKYSDISGLYDMSGMRSPTEIMTNSIKQQDKETETLGSTWKRTGQIIASSLSRAIVMGRSFNDTLKEMGAMLVEISFQLILAAAFKGGGIVPKAANGYIVPGTSYTGDKVPILANSGEMILNGQQQAGLFNFINQRMIPQPGNVSYNRPIRIEIAPIQIQGSATARGRDLNFNFEKYDSIKTKFYGKGIRG